MREDSFEARSPSAPDGPGRGLIRWLYCNNPFYVVSAALVCFGLRASFDPNGKVFEVWVLLLGMAGYTLLLAATACALIRLGEVWDDVRTIMLLVVLMFLSVSVIFDDTMTCHPRLGRACYLGALAFSVVVSEGLLRGVRLRLPALFRVPYYLFLGLFFLYPVVLGPLLTSPSNPMAVSNPALPWALFGFSTVAGLLTLTLLPAARRGADYVAGNGSPWPWPLYPWSLFVILGVGVCGRAYYACISLHPVERSGTIFGPYFLVPFLLAVALVLLEIGLASRSRGALNAAMLTPFGLLVLAAIGHRTDAVYWQFLRTFMATLGGSPLYLTALAASAFCVYAKLRRVPGSLGWLSAALGALVVIAPTTVDVGGLSAPRPLPLLALAGLHLALAARRRDSLHALFGATCLVASVTLALPLSWPQAPRAVVAFHLGVAASLAIGAVFRDTLGDALRGLGLLALLAGSWIATAGAGSGDPRLFAWMPAPLVAAYPPLLAAIAVAYGFLIRDRFPHGVAALSFAGWLLGFGWRGYLQLRHMVAGLDQITWGLLSFLLAALISLAKAGLLSRWTERRGKSYHPSE